MKNIFRASQITHPLHLFSGEKIVDETDVGILTTIEDREMYIYVVKNCDEYEVEEFIKDNVEACKDEQELLTLIKLNFEA